MSKNIKIDAKNASITEIRTAIETLNDLEKKKLYQEAKKERDAAAAKYDGQWIIETKKSAIMEETRIILLDKVCTTSYEILKGLRVDASVVKVFKTMLDSKGIRHNSVAFDPKMSVSFFDRDVKIVKFDAAKKAVEAFKKSFNTSLDQFLVFEKEPS